MDIKFLCRICLCLPKLPIDIFENKEFILDKINLISNVKINYINGLPNNICSKCLKNVNHMYNFRKVIEHSDYDLKSRLKTLEQTNYLIKRNSKQFGNNIPNENEKFEFVHIKSGPIEEQCDKSTVQPSSKRKITNARILRTLATSAKKRTHKCTKCPAQFPSRNKLAVHRIREHRLKIVCDICGTEVREYNFTGHLATHSAPNQCSLCGNTLKNAASLRTHLAKKHGQLKHFCNICGKGFPLSYDYKRHCLGHTDPSLIHRRKQCSVCGKTVVSLKNHMLTHTGEKPHICHYCNKGFQGKYGLKVHIRQHTNERPYVCEHCGKAFTQTVSLKTHLKSKHGIIKKKVDTS